MRGSEGKTGIHYAINYAEYNYTNRGREMLAMVENKVTLTTSPSAGDIVTILATFNTSSWTLAAVSTWSFSLIWE